MAGSLKKHIGVIILAAGSSSRLGKPKQLLMVGGKSLIIRVCEAALSLNIAKVVVVTGAYAERVRSGIVHLPVMVIFNEEWEEGMASSIRKGMEVLSSQMDAVIILLCDQVNLNSSLLAEIRDAYLNSSFKVVYCRYGDEIGVPALFDKAMFPELFQLRGDTGAKPIIKRHLEQSQAISFPGGDTDIDRPSDVRDEL